MMLEAPSEYFPPPLLLLRQTEPGILYHLASKAYLVAAARQCDRHLVSRVLWEDGDRVLKLVCVDGAEVSYRAVDHLTPHCSCSIWNRQSQCPHVVFTWIQLKRLLSPASFPQIRISNWILADLADLVGLPYGPYKEKQPSRPGKSPLVSGLNASTPGAAVPGERGIRFVLEVAYGRLFGAFRLGGERIYHWMTGVPRDLMLCIQRFPFFEASLRHLTALRSATGGRYPIMFLDSRGREWPLAPRPDDPRRACLCFRLDQGEVKIQRTVNGTTPLADGIVIAHELMLDLGGGTIHHLDDAKLWSVWDAVDGALSNPGGEGEEFDEPGEQAPFSAGSDGLTTTAGCFNQLCLRLTEELEAEFGRSLFFLQGEEQADTYRRGETACLLELPPRLDAPQIRLRPRLFWEGARFPFSAELLSYFDPRRRSRLPAPLKAKKRVRTILETCFALLDCPTPTAARKLIRIALSGPDYIKRSVKSDARQILNRFAEQVCRKPVMIQVQESGWRFADDDRRAQVRLMKVLYDFFGSGLWESWDEQEGMVVEREELLAVLPRLAERLQQEGIALRLGDSPLSAAVWDFSLDASSSTLDWFELRPEIRCDGELVSGEELQRLARGGVLERDGRLILIDDMNARILAMLAGIVVPSRRRKKGEPQVARIPRLQILDWLQLRSHGVRIALAPEDARVLESLVNFQSIPRLPLPSGLNGTLRPYQRDGYHWLAFLYEHRFGACLADDMGLGKTIQSISLLAGIADGTVSSRAEGVTPHLVVVPPSLLFNWESELSRFFPAASVLTYAGPGRSCDEFRNSDVVLTSYGIVQRDIEKLALLRFNVIIFDEAQVVKNIKAATTAAVRRLAGCFKLALTGTPVENRIEEFYAVMDLCLPGLLGSLEEFGRRMASQGEAGMEILLRRTRPFVLRRNKQLIAAELPEKIETDIKLELAPKQRALYQRTIEEVRGLVSEAFSRRSAGQARIIALTALLRLRQICLAPSLALAGASDVSPKLEFLIEQLAELLDEGHSVLVFSQFTTYLDLVESALGRHHLPCLRLDGSTPTPQRKRLVQDFQSSDTPLIFLISLKAGGRGLNLTRATYVYHLDPWWNPAVENQASDRAHRIGQSRRVTVTRLIMRHTIEEKMMLLKEQKLKLYRAILDEGRGGRGAALTREDLDFLLG